MRLFTLSFSLGLLLFVPPIYRQYTDNHQKYATTLDYMSLSDATKSISLFQLIAIIVNTVFISSSSVSLKVKIRRCIMGHFIGTIIFTLIIYCCGASLFVKTWKQKELNLGHLSYDLYILSILLSSLTLMPLFIKYSFNTNVIINRIMNVDNNQSFIYPFWCTIIGVMCGSYILALDWFKPYQVFPIPCLIGAFYGHFIGYFASAFYGKLFVETKTD